MNLSVYHLALVALSGMAFYTWCSRFARRPVCLVASLVYVLAPYHYLDTEIRNSLGEGMAYLWLPLILSALHAVSVEARPAARNIILTAIFYAGLIVSHLPSALLVVPFMATYVGVLTKENAYLRSFARLAVIGLTGVALAGIYLIPALQMRQYLPPDIWVGGSGDIYKPENWLLFSGTIEKFGILVYADLALTTLLSLAGLLVLALVRRRGATTSATFDDDSRRMLAAALIALAVSWFHMLNASHWIWVDIEVLRQVQFPWRLGVEVDFWAASVVTVALSGIMQIGAKKRPDVTRYLAAITRIAVLLVPIAADITHIVKYRGALSIGAWNGPLPTMQPVPVEYPF